MPNFSARWSQIIAKSLKFAIHFVQWFHAPLPLNFKMAAFLSADQVREMVAQDVEMIEEENEETILVDKIKNCLEKVATPNIDAEFFVNSRVSMLVPLYEISQRGVAGTPQAAHLLKLNILASTILRSESRLWLEAIYRRLAGRRRIRTPFQAEITRDIPHEFFGVFCRVIKSTEGFAEPFVSVVANSKTETVSFMTLRPVKQLFSVLSGLSEREVVQHFKRSLTRRKVGSKVSLLACQEKNMVFLYKLNKGQLTISFHFGEWNSHGFPQHN